MNDYPRFHQDRGNPVIHIVMVPVFVVGAAATIASQLAAGEWLSAGLPAAAAVLSLAAQGLSRKREQNPPLPFRGPADFLSRSLNEQFFRFPAFVAGGGWWRAWRRASSSP